MYVLLTMALCGQYDAELAAALGEPLGLLGVEATDVAGIEPAQLKQSRLPVKKGVVLRTVEIGSPAEKIGLQNNDVLVQIDGKDADIEHVKSWVLDHKASSKLLIYRLKSRVWTRQTLDVSLRVPKAIGREEPPRVPPPSPASITKALADWKAWEDQQARIEPQNRAFELKGDRLGMTLDMFKAKHNRAVKGDPRPAPFCSDERPDMANPALLYTPELQKAGIIHARTTFPFEEIASDSNRPTIAGVPAKLYVYRFVDKKLYEITISIEHDDFQSVLAAVNEKFGKPMSKETHTYQNRFGAKFEGDSLRWENNVSEVVAVERAGSIDNSVLMVMHKELTKMADDRMKAANKPRTDDL